MKKIYILIILFLDQVMSRLSPNSEECSIFLDKFFNVSFVGELILDNEQTGITVNIKYSDQEYFDNSTFYGLVQQDGHTENETCLDLQLYQNIENKEKLIDVDHFNNSEQKMRMYSFFISSIDIQNNFFQNENSQEYVYFCSYYMNFNIIQSKKIYKYYFAIYVVINKDSYKIVESIITDFSLEIDDPQGVVEVGSIASFDFCNGFDDTNRFNDYDQPLQIEQILFLKVKILYQIYANYYLTNAIIYQQANDLIKKITILEYDESNQGYAIYKIKIQYAWYNFSFTIFVNLSSKQGQRSTSQIQYTNSNEWNQLSLIMARTNGYTCTISNEEPDQCATCHEQCQINGFTVKQCNNYICSYQQLITIIISIYIMFI